MYNLIEIYKKKGGMKKMLKLKVLGMSRFDFQNERNERIVGAKVLKIDEDNKQNNAGVSVSSIPASEELYNKFEGSGIYDVELDLFGKNFRVIGFKKIDDLVICKVNKKNGEYESA